MQIGPWPTCLNFSDETCIFDVKEKTPSLQNDVHVTRWFEAHLNHLPLLYQIFLKIAQKQEPLSEI